MTTSSEAIERSRSEVYGILIFEAERAVDGFHALKAAWYGGANRNLHFYLDGYWGAIQNTYNLEDRDRALFVDAATQYEREGR
jgi:hypothetical protein